MINSLSLKIYPKTTIKRINNKIKLLGKSYNHSAIFFLNMRLLVAILVFIISLVIFKYGFIIAPILTILIYFLVEKLELDYEIKKRGKRLEKEALFFMEVLVMTLEGGRNLEHALKLTVQNIQSELSLEFEEALKEVHLGKSLNESLEAMKKRIPSEVINNTILNMIQANTYGTNITIFMDNQIEFLRNKQLLDVKAEIAKLPTKVSVISVLFFVPIMLLIILAPVLIKLISN